jgi:hypothetical protein
LFAYCSDKITKMKTKRIYIRVTDEFLTDSQKVADAADMKLSQIAREGISEKIESLRQIPRVAQKLSEQNLAVAA